MLPTGSKVFGSASIIAVLCFFMPWVQVSCANQPVASFSDFQLASGGSVQSGLGAPVPIPSNPELYLILLAGLGVLTLAFLLYQGKIAVSMAATVAMGLGSLSILVMLMKFSGSQGNALQSGVSVSMQAGFWGTALANIGIILGGVLDLRRSKATIPAYLSAVPPMTTASGGPPSPGAAAPRFCMHCGKALSPNARFCASCGKQN